MKFIVDDNDDHDDGEEVKKEDGDNYGNSETDYKIVIEAIIINNASNDIVNSISLLIISRGSVL